MVFPSWPPERLKSYAWAVLRSTIHFFLNHSYYLFNFYVSDIREVIVTEQVGILTPWDLDSWWQNDMKNI